MNPADWQPVDVATELKHLGLGNCSKKFIEKGICGLDLYTLDDGKLRQLGLLVGQRVTFLNWVQTLPPPGAASSRGAGKGRAKKTTTTATTSSRAAAPTSAAGGGSRGVARPPLGRNYDQEDDFDLEDAEPPMPPPKRTTPMTRAAPSSSKPTSTATATATATKSRAGPTKSSAAPTKSSAAPTKSSAAPTKSSAAPAKSGVSAIKRPANRFTNNGPPLNVPESGDDGDRVACRYCQRRFASDRIEKHESVCLGASKKRKVFDAKKMRVSGTEAAQYQRSSNRRNDNSKPSKEMINGKPKYKVEHENLVAALRAARKMTAYEEARQAGKKVGPPPKMPVIQDVPDDREQCPYCGRRFGAEQFQRHFNSCARNAPIPKVSAAATRRAAGGNARGAATRGAAVRGKRY